MALKKEQIEQLQDKLLMAQNAEEIANAVKAAGCEMPDAEAAGFLAKVKAEGETEGKLADEAMLPVSGGIEVSNVPQYQVIKDYYYEKGPNLAFILCIYYIPPPTCYDIIKLIEHEEEYGE